MKLPNRDVSFFTFLLPYLLLFSAIPSLLRSGSGANAEIARPQTSQAQGYGGPPQNTSPPRPQPPRPQPQPQPQPPQGQDPCRLPADPGMCYAYFPRFYYDAQYDSCREFGYGGCGGNANNFYNRQDCERFRYRCLRRPGGGRPPGYNNNNNNNNNNNVGYGR